MVKSTMLPYLSLVVCFFMYILVQFIIYMEWKSLICYNYSFVEVPPMVDGGIYVDITHQGLYHRFISTPNILNTFFYVWLVLALSGFGIFMVIEILIRILAKLD